MHRVLEMPEILELILSFLDEHSNANNVAVCRQWSRIAIGILWREVSDIRKLFSLLAPMQLLPLARYDDFKDRYVGL